MLFGILTGPIVGVLFDRNMLQRKKEINVDVEIDYSDRLQTTFWPYVIALFLCIVFQIMALAGNIDAMVRKSSGKVAIENFPTSIRFRTFHLHNEGKIGIYVQHMRIYFAQCVHFQLTTYSIICS